jgi:membrane-associated phospholipid phosphatase
MKKLLLLTAIAVAGLPLPFGSAKDADNELPRSPILTWNELALNAVRKANLIDAQAARLYAMVNVAMYDAVNGIESAHGPGQRASALIDAAGAPQNGKLDAAAAAAAHAVLVALDPARASMYDTQLNNDLATLGQHPKNSAGQTWGDNVGRRVVEARANDGSSPTEAPQPAGAGPGQFRAIFRDPQFRFLKPFGIANSSVYKGAGPAPLPSLDYAAAFYVVKILGKANPTTGSAGENVQKTGTFRFWALGSNTAQPPGAWLQIALDVISRNELGLADASRLLALETMAMADTVAPTFLTKYDFHHWRPTTAIQEATTPGDLNDLTEGEPGWTSRGGVGGSPEYWSGHSSFSAAAASVLAGFFCTDTMSFSLSGDPSDPNAAGQTRTYSSFSAAAEEAGISRIYGGLHFPFSNIDGLAAGRAIAREILGNKLLLQKGQTHFGQCPL